MSLWTNIANFIRGKSSLTIDDWWAEYGQAMTSSGGVSVTQITALQVSTVLACVSILSEDVAKLTAHVYKKRPNGGLDVQENHPLERLLQHPNGYQSKFEFVEQMQAALLLRGNAYAVIIRDGRGRPTALIPVNPDQVSIYEAPDGSVFYMVARSGPHIMAMLQSQDRKSVV